MCGIAGAFDLIGRREFSTARLRAMCQAIAHRGPDDEHIHVERGVALGARRLSIVDLAGGRQPLCNETGDVWVAYNGELFEYPELFEQLKQRGHRFTTRCDTELWVHLYEDHGSEIFQHTKGQYAVSLWDARERKLTLARDRVGIMPLFYAQVDGWLIWSSEVKGILASGMIDPEPDLKNLDHFFTCIFSSSQTRSFFAGIHCLPPGAALTAHNGQTEIKRYWRLEYPDAGQEYRNPNIDGLTDEFEQLLRQAVRRRLRGDVPVVSYLSGGIDSTVVTTLAAQESKALPKAYTIGLLDTGKNEQFEAENTCRVLGIPFSVLEMNKRMMADGFPELVRAAEAPLIDTTCACMIRLAKEVRSDGFKVTLSGEGADEAVGGYEWGNLATANPVRRGAKNLLARLMAPRIRYRSADGSQVTIPFRGIAGARTPQQSFYEFLAYRGRSLFSDATQQSLWGHSPLAELNPLPDRFAQWTPLSQSTFLDYSVFLHGHLLSTKGDRTAMNASIEARPPFLDEDVVAFCAKLAPEYKVQGKIRKWLLRRVAARWLPAEITQRPKRGFRASFSELFLGADHPDWVDQLLSQESLAKSGLFDAQRLSRCRAKHASAAKLGFNRPAIDMALTAVISTQLWYHTFCGGGLADLPVWELPSAAAVKEDSAALKPARV